MPTYNNEMSAAVAVMNRGEYGTPTKVTFTPRSIGLTYDGGYLVKEVFESTNMGSKLPDDEIEVMVNPSGGTGFKILFKILMMLRYNNMPNQCLVISFHYCPYFIFRCSTNETGCKG